MSGSFRMHLFCFLLGGFLLLIPIALNLLSPITGLLFVCLSLISLEGPLCGLIGRRE